MPDTYEEALMMLYQNDLEVLAGGTDLMVKKRNWAGLPPEFKKDVLFTAGIRELDFVKRELNHIHIGAASTLETILHDIHTPPLLKKAVSQVASPGIRNIATLAGNIGNASPAGDTLPVLYILDAKIVLGREGGERIVPIEDFITGPGSVDRHRVEMIKEIIINDTDYDYTMFEKVGGRKTDTISKVCLAGGLVAKVDVVGDINIAIGAVAPTIVRLREYESRLRYMMLEDLGNMVDQIADVYAPHIKPIDDQRSTAEYRKECALNLLKKFIGEVSKKSFV